MEIRAFVPKLKKYQKPLEKYLFPLILFLYPFIGVRQGVDVTDTTYSLGNFQYQNQLDRMWMLATYLPNVLGRAMTFLPGGDTMLGMNIYATLLICIMALIVYVLLQKWMPGWMIFIGEFIAISLCWCPHVILYNYMTYLFLTLGALCLLYALTIWKGNALHFILAGFFLGLNVMVRFPNVVEAALILTVWFYGALEGKKLLQIVRETLLCMLGYVIGIGIPMLMIIAGYGVSAYGNMITALFGMTGGASDYSFGGMLGSILGAYGHTLSVMAIMVPCVAAGVLMFLMKQGRYLRGKKLLYLAGILFLFKYFFSRGIFTTNYFYYDSMFQAAMMFIIVAIVCSVLGMSGWMNGSKEERALSLMTLLLILITPIGSNNYTFPLVNNLFLIAPVTLWLLRRLIQRAGDGQLHFAWKSMAVALILLLIVQGTLFHFQYSFVDGADGQARDTQVTGIPRARGMVTTAANAHSLQQLYDFLQQNGLAGQKVIQFGKAPGVCYLMNLEPAIFSLWPDLDSNTTERFDEAMTNLDPDEQPLIIVHPDFNGEVLAEQKYDILLDYMANYDYNKVFENDNYVVYEADENPAE